MSERGAVPGPQCDDLDFSERIRFPEVIRSEYGEIENRRKVAGQTHPPPHNGRPRKIAGLSLSGGGIRSATFNLGLLQALAAAGKLARFDYLSTVSGGGYTGGWWSAWLARPERDTEPGQVFPPPENLDHERDNRRAKMEHEAYEGGVERPQIKDSAINAATDPIHHLRLFSNFLTPKKGLLSGDTWRAIATISRNLVLTWLILLPVILAAIVAGQAFFALALGDSKNLLLRLLYALIIPGMLLLGNVAAINVWILATRRLVGGGDKIIVVLSGVAFVALSAIFLTVLGVPGFAIIALTLILLLWILYTFGRLFWWQKVEKPEHIDDAYWRNRLGRLQTRTLAYAVFSAVILLFAGFGYVLFDLLLDEGRNRAAQAGGWGALAFSLISAAYTAYSASPKGGADVKATGKPPLLQRIAFAVAPILFLLAIGILLSAAGNALYNSIRAAGNVQYVSYGALISAFLFLFMSVYEFRPRLPWAILIALGTVWLVLIWGATKIRIDSHQLLQIGAWTLAALSVVLIARAILRKRWWIVGYAAVLAIFSWLLFAERHRAITYVDDRLTAIVVAGIAATLLLLAIELAAGRGANTRCIALSIIACSIFVLVGAAASLGGTLGQNAMALLSIVAICLGWVVALGWLSDPNSLTIHAFYKARLVRAYMGASNGLRAQAKDADITDAVPGDDVLLTELRNTDRGAPYHLVNTMLNLTGGSDLATQARHSDSFLMSKHFIGSVRTGYRRTSDYACGSVTLGTAVAVSGAAASPAMGAQTPSAALSALMTLFNVRTGYWTPTPSLSYWRSASTRLWPVYTLQELVASTTDLLPYCYLTDGGHYENTGAYSLIQRGCNVIVVGECGADPETTLDDIGNLIRKVRIDFGTEITFSDADIDILRKRPPGAHVIVGKIHYDPRHAASLGLPDDEHEGTIVIVKPNLSGGEPVDVKQYGYLNSDFPQQQTFDLWYDEAQFESYRSLGQLSGEVAVKTGKF